MTYFKLIFRYFKKKLKSFNINLFLFNFRSSWRKNNKHNFTSISSYIPFEAVKIGKYTYGTLNIKYFSNCDEMLEIGNFCSIAEDVVFLTGGGHNMHTVSTYPFKAYFKVEEEEVSSTKGKIIVCDDVWIGYGATILSGVKIGQGAVIGAKSIVAKDVPPYSIFVGNKVIKKRFSDEIIEKMIKFDFSKLSEQDIKDNIELLYKKMDESFFETDFYKNHLK